MKIASLALALILHSVFSMLNPVSAAAAETVVVTPEITDEALVNPGMGWVYYHYSNRLWAYGARTAPGDTLDWFPGVATIYLRVLWSDLEPARSPGGLRRRRWRMPRNRRRSHRNTAASSCRHGKRTPTAPAQNLDAALGED
jgi:hypothetical protein